MVPTAVTVGVLVNPQDHPDISDMIPAARALGMQLSFLTAVTDADIEAAFAAVAERRIEALLVSDRPFFTVRPQPNRRAGGTSCIAGGLRLARARRRR
jgi:hypothetical protein